MPSVEELLSQNSEETYADIWIEYCTVDDDTRMVTVPDKYKKLGVESDEKAKRIWFRFPKLVGNNGVDLSAIGVRVKFRNANGEGDIYIIEDLTTDGDYVTFSWELTRKVTAYKGNVSFVVCAVKSNTDGTTKNEWNTALNKECEVLEGLEVTEQIEQENPDIIEYILANLGGSVSAEQIAQAVEEYLAENPPFGMTADEKAQMNKNTEDISQLSEQKVDNPSTGAVGQILEIESVGEDGKPKTYKAVDKPISGGVTSWNDLKDKPFGESGEEVWVLDKTSLIFAGESSNSLEVSDEVVQLFTTAGNKVYVYWNGVIHECEVQYHNVAMYYYISFGNYTAFLEGNTLTLEFGETMIGAFEFGLLSSVAELKQLDEKYIPETIARKEDIPENTDVPENVLTYSEQSLTEEQKMQARKNLGLYYSEEVAITEDVFSYVYVGCWEVTEDNLSNTSITDEQYLVTLLDNTYEVYGKSRVTRVNTVGITQGLFWIGNPTLIDNVPSNIDISGETDYTDLPFVVYWNKVNVDTGNGEMIGSPTVVLDPSVSISMMGQGLFIGTVKGEETVHTPIPKEFIPILYDYIILNSSDESGKQFKITVNDEGTLTATEITD